MTADRELDPELAAALEEGPDHPPTHTLSVAAARRLREQGHVPPEEADTVAAVRDLGIEGPDGGDLRIRVYEPEEAQPLPAIVYFHGGGWVVGSIEGEEPLCRALANAAGAVVISVEYRLAPEHPFPAALEDAYTTTDWVTEQSDLLGVDPDCVAVAGVSAGGNLAAAVSLLARERGGPSIAFQLPICPVIDHTLEYDSFAENAEWGPSREAMEWYWDQYLDRDVDAANPYAAPVQARSLADLPPATVITADLDGLRDEGIAYGERLKEAGVPTTLRNYEGTTHGFVRILNQPDYSRARAAIEDITADLEGPLGG